MSRRQGAVYAEKARYCLIWVVKRARYDGATLCIGRLRTADHFLKQKRAFLGCDHS